MEAHDASPHLPQACQSTDSTPATSPPGQWTRMHHFKLRATGLPRQLSGAGTSGVLSRLADSRDGRGPGRTDLETTGRRASRSRVRADRRPGPANTAVQLLVQDAFTFPSSRATRVSHQVTPGRPASGDEVTRSLLGWARNGTPSRRGFDSNPESVRGLNPHGPNTPAGARRVRRPRNSGLSGWKGQ
jgi:hypothetical protein